MRGGGALVGVWLPVELVPSEDGRTVAAGPTPIPETVRHEPGGRAMVLATAGVWAGLAGAATDDGGALVRAVLCAVAAFAVFAVVRFVNPAALGGGT